MVGKEPDIGPSARTVADNVKRFRTGRNMNYTDLSERLQSVAGWSINAVGIRRIESGERRVTPDDLVALALALGVSPLALLLPTEAGALVPGGDRYPVGRIWEWARGERPLSGDALTFMRDSNPLDWVEWEAAASGRDADIDAAAVLKYKVRSGARERKRKVDSAFDEVDRSDRPLVLIEYSQDTHDHLKGDRWRVDEGSAQSLIAKGVAREVLDGDD